ncbi:MAG: CPBP family intramembrane metalloprotease [Dehalococcoidia bacterium]|nr:CPBP family intramembrane metalloprotease [Dehalococcoidia bacterium]MDW8120009.1 CPBP family intramembrane glutamic endopeptidase [Chloroflexota bacterium]
MLWPLAIALFLVGYNLLPFFAGRLHERVYVPLNLGVGLLLMGVARWGLGLSWEGMGWSGKGLGASLGWGALVGLVLGLPALVGAFLLPRLPGPAQSFAPPDAPSSPASLAYHVLLRIPLGTALFEEVAFRGVVFGLVAQRLSPLHALLFSAGAFALWHIGPILVRLRAHEVHGLGPLVWQWAGGLGGTFLGGLLLGGLRWGTGTLAGPVVAHTLLNALGLLAWSLLRRP